MTDEDADEGRIAQHRGFALVLVGMAVAVWWPAFTLGAWGTLFFEQVLTVWVIATAGIIVILVQPRRLGRRWPRVLALLVPSLWLVLAFIPDPESDDLLSAIVALLAITVGLVGIPFTLWTILRVLWPDLFHDLSLRARLGVLASVAAIAAACFVLGLAQSHFLTCEDFSISGNSLPPGCVHAPHD